MREILKVHMEIIPASKMRPKSSGGWGDYWLDADGVLQIRAVEFPDLMFSHYVLLHEYMEAVRCARDGVDYAAIDKWDAEHPITEAEPEPGEIEGAPYFVQHAQSMALERLACEQDGKDFDHYPGPL